MSYAQGAVDWTHVCETGMLTFAYVKATEGHTILDEQFTRSRDALARQSMLLHGAYHYFVFTSDPIAQANFFLATIAPAHGDLLPMVDVEDAQGAALVADPQERLGSFTDAVERVLGRRMLLYTNLGFWNSAMAGSNAFAGHPLWIAQYNADPQPVLPPAWQTWTFWQYSDGGAVDGVATNVDMDRFNGSPGELRALLL